MNNNKIREPNTEKILCAIIQIRKRILHAIREKCDGMEREVYTRAERECASKEYRAVAELIRDKDELTPRALRLPKIREKDRINLHPIIEKVRLDAIGIVQEKRNNIVATQYDEEELAVVEKELDEIELLIKEKDRIRPRFITDICGNEGAQNYNPHLNNFFSCEKEID